MRQSRFVGNRLNILILEVFSYLPELWLLNSREGSMKKVLLAALILPLSSVAFAQGTQTGQGAGAEKPRQPGPEKVSPSGSEGTSVVKPGGVENSGPGSAATEIRGPTGAESRTNNPGADANAGKPEMPVGNTGGGGK